MKRNFFLFACSLILIMGPIVHAQDTTQTPVGQRQGGARGTGGGQRQGGDPQLDDLIRKAAYEDTLTIGNRVVSLAPGTYTATSTWWNNANTVAKLGLTDVQKSRIESTFEAHRQNLVSRKEQLEKEEAQLGRLLDAESIDRGSIFTQINRVVQARGEMERENAAMTLEMRELLTRAQWTQLQTASPVRWEVAPALGGLGIATPPAAGARGARGGARSGNPPQQ